MDSAAGLDWGPVHGERTVITPSSKACSPLLSPFILRAVGSLDAEGPHFASEEPKSHTKRGGSVLSWPCWAPGSQHCSCPLSCGETEATGCQASVLWRDPGQGQLSFGDCPQSHLPRTSAVASPPSRPGSSLPLHPPGLSILRPWSSVPQGLFLHWWSWLVMAMKCCLLALGSSSLEGNGACLVNGSNTVKQLKCY